MQVRLLDTENLKDVDKFVMFPFQHYAQNEQWVPPLVSSAKKQLNREVHPFYEHSAADFFLAEENGRTLGRIAVMENKNFNNYRHTQAAFFGLFESVEDPGVSQALFDSAFEWARARGLTSIVGPRSLNSTSAGGLLVEGFDHRPALNIPYNYAYYDRLVKASGFEKDTDHLSAYLPGDYPLPDRVLRLAEKVKQRRGLWIMQFQKKEEIYEWVPKVVEIYSTAFRESHTFFPMTRREMDMIASDIIQVTDPGLVKGVMKGDDLVGFVISYYDISAALQRSKGRLWPFGWYWLLTEKKRTTWVNVNGLGLLPEYQGLGGNVLLYAELSKSIREYGFKHMDLVQVNESNQKSMAEMEALGAKWYKRHRAYQRDL
jgi:GNAT superfamily N-acetyltransferase